MSKPRLLDLFSGAGGAARGYQRAGYHVTGVDHVDQPRFAGDEFVQADALEYVAEYGHEYDAIHASPPCQAYTTIRVVAGGEYPETVAATRAALRATGKPYVIENVPGAPLESPIMLCGSSFGLNLRRHRLFESSVWLSPLPCDHSWQEPRFRSLNGRYEGLARVVGVHGNIQYAGEYDLRCEAMGISWMTNAELTQAIPPAFTEHVGTQLAWHLEPRKESA